MGGGGGGQRATFKHRCTTWRKQEPFFIHRSEKKSKRSPVNKEREESSSNREAHLPMSQAGPTTTEKQNSKSGPSWRNSSELYKPWGVGRGHENATTVSHHNYKNIRNILSRMMHIFFFSSSLSKTLQRTNSIFFFISSFSKTKQRLCNI